METTIIENTAVNTPSVQEEDWHVTRARYQANKTYFWAKSALLRGRDSRKLQNNTYVRFNKIDESISIRLHNTDVVVFFPDGCVTVRTAGWNTLTTRDRITEYAPGYAYTDSGVCFFVWKDKRVPLDDSITLHPDGRITACQGWTMGDKELTEADYKAAYEQIKEQRRENARYARQEKKRRELEAEARRIEAEKWESMMEEYSSLPICRRDSLSAGNCEGGTSAFIARYLPQVDKDTDCITIGEVWTAAKRAYNADKDRAKLAIMQAIRRHKAETRQAQGCE